MPYIKASHRKFLADGGKPVSSGELNYLITKLCVEYIQEAGLNYANLNTVMGALESAKQEFYRRKVAPYEDLKIQENGDVY